jgi:hypothetical protein
MSLRRTRRTVQAASKLAENPEGSLPAQMQTWKESKALYRLRGCTGCLLCGVDAASCAADEGASQGAGGGSAGARYAVTLIYPIDTRSVGWDKSVTNEGVAFSCKPCWQSDLRHARCWAAWPRSRMSRTPAPAGEQRYQWRKREARETDVWMRQIQTIGTPDPASMWVHVGDRGADMFPFCRSLSGHPYPLSGTRWEVTAYATKRGRDRLLAHPGSLLVQPGQPSVRGSRQTWATEALDAAAAGLWATDSLTPTP